MELKLLEKVDVNPCGESRESFKAPTLLRGERQDLGRGIRENLSPELLGLPVGGDVQNVQQSRYTSEREGQLCNVNMMGANR